VCLQAVSRYEYKSLLVGGALMPNIFQRFTAKAVPTGLARGHHCAYHFVGVKFISREALTTVPRLRRAKQA